MKPVFVDTSGFFGLFVQDDAHHEYAQELFGRAEFERWRLLTSWFIIFETYALFLNRTRRGRDIALSFLDNFGNDRVEIIGLHPPDISEALEIVRSHRDKKYSLCDAHSFVVMERLKVSTAISFDSDFRSYGRVDIL